VEATWTIQGDVIKVRDLEGRLFTERLAPGDNAEHVAKTAAREIRQTQLVLQPDQVSSSVISLNSSGPRLLLPRPLPCLTAGLPRR